jgi:hypothetical protein
VSLSLFSAAGDEDELQDSLSMGSIGLQDGATMFMLQGEPGLEELQTQLTHLKEQHRTDCQAVRKSQCAECEPMKLQHATELTTMAARQAEALKPLQDKIKCLIDTQRTETRSLATAHAEECKPLSLKHAQEWKLQDEKCNAEKQLLLQSIAAKTLEAQHAQHIFDCPACHVHLDGEMLQMCAGSCNRQLCLDNCLANTCSNFENFGAFNLLAPVKGGCVRGFDDCLLRFCDDCCNQELRLCEECYQTVCDGCFMDYHGRNCAEWDGNGDYSSDDYY